MNFSKKFEVNLFNMKSSLFQFYFFDIRSTGAAEGINGGKKIEKILCGTL